MAGEVPGALTGEGSVDCGSGGSGLLDEGGARRGMWRPGAVVPLGRIVMSCVLGRLEASRGPAGGGSSAL
jgi:hypothetical protein